MSKRVLYYSHLPIQQSPPCVMEICVLRDLGYEVFVLTTNCSPETRALFDSKGVVCETYGYKVLPNKLIQKCVNFYHYGKVFHDFFAKYWNEEAVFWVGDEQSAMRMRPYLFHVHPYIQNCLEFYEGDPYNNGMDYQKIMKKVCRSSDVVTACQVHRGQYMVDWWGLKQFPYIIPNKPYTHPRGRFVEGSIPEAKEAIEKIRGKKNIMYQGGICSDRDLSFLAQALNDADSEYYLVLSGLDYDGDVAKLTKIYPRTIYLGNIPTPYHLEVTSHATICVAFYVDNCINNRYCAPNKIYEYAGCGVPMLCNDIPGLTETVGAAGAGVCVDYSDPKSILAGIQEINDNYDAFSQAAHAFYEGTDNVETIRQIVEEAFSKRRGSRK